MSLITLKWLTKIYVYLRTSGEVNPDHSIQTQKRLVDRYAKKHGLEIIDYLIDEKKTGLNQNREGFQNLQTLIEKDLVEVILVPYFDRIGRNDFEVSLFLMKLKKKGIECISVGEQKLLSMMGEQEIVQATINADVENRNRTERILSSKEESLTKGEYIYKVPVGYKKDQNRRLVPDENAELIKDIFKQFIRLGSVSKVVAYFKKLPEWNHINFHHAFIHNTLNKRLYLGNLYLLEKESNSSRLLSEDTHPALVSEDVFQRAQKLLEITPGTFIYFKVFYFALIVRLLYLGQRMYIGVQQKDVPYRQIILSRCCWYCISCV